MVVLYMAPEKRMPLRGTAARQFYPSGPRRTPAEQPDPHDRRQIDADQSPAAAPGEELDAIHSH